MNSNNYAIDGNGNSAAVEMSGLREGKFRLTARAVLFLAASFAVLLWALLSGFFRDGQQQLLNAEICLPLAIGAGLILNGLLINSRWRNFGFWTAAALIGQAASLQLINAGRLIHFQHYRPFSELLGQEFLPLILLAAQIVFVALGIGGRFPAIKNWLSKTFAVWQLILIAIFLILAGAAVTPDVSVYATSLIFAAVVQLVGLANIILAVWAVPEENLERFRQKIESVFGETDEKTKKPFFDKFALVSALWIVVLTATLSFFVYQNHPHVPDETQYLFQAKYMAAGQLTAKPPLVPEAFSMYMVPFQDARWYGIFPPAFPAMLAIGLKFNAAWLVNPIFAGLCILLVYAFFRELYSRRFARIAVLLLCCSPWFVFMAMSFMSHIFTLFCALCAAVLLQNAFRKSNVFYVLGAGLAIGVVSLIRPLDGLIVAFLLGIWTLVSCPAWTAKIKTSAALVIGTILSAALVFPYNKSITGSATLLPMDAYYTKYFWKDVMALGFGQNRGMDWGLDAFPGHSPLEAVVNAALNTFLMNTELLGWAIGSLLLTVFFVVSGGIKRKDFWAIAVIAVIVGSYSFYWYSGGPDFGARYWFLCIIPLIALTVRGIEWLSGKIEESKSDKPRINSRVMLAVITMCAITVISYFPWRALDKYYHYLEMQPGIVQLAKENNFGRSLVLIRGGEHPDYQSAWIYNPLNFEGDAPIYAWDKNAEVRERLLRAYADRPVWIVDGPTITKSNYQIVEGPLRVEELLTENRK